MREAGSGDLPVTRLWDLPVRLVHWSFALLLVPLWLSAEKGRIDVHKVLGLIMLALIVFRLLWGVVGSSTARFTGFVAGPARVMAYLRGLRGGAGPVPVVGHNPLGGWSVVALLGLLTLQVALGLVAQDTDGVQSGPLNRFVSYDIGKRAGELHELVFNGLLVLIAIHLAAILFYRFVKKDNLIAPMITGTRRFSVAVAAPVFVPWWRAAVCAALAAAVAGGIYWQDPPVDPATESYM